MDDLRAALRKLVRIDPDPNMSFIHFQAPSVPPSFLITKPASEVVWQTSTSTWSWRTPWTGATAGWYRSSPVNSAALCRDEGRSPAPWTAAWSALRPGRRRRRKRRRRRRRGGSFHLRPDPRRETPPDPKYRDSTAQARLVSHRVRRPASPAEPDRRSVLKTVPVTRSVSRSATGMKQRTVNTVSGGLGRTDGMYLKLDCMFIFALYRFSQYAYLGKTVYVLYFPNKIDKIKNMSLFY